MAAVLAAGDGALLSHASAASLWGISVPEPFGIEVTVPAPRHPRVAGLRVHTSTRLGRRDRALRKGISLTSPVRTLVDLAARLSDGRRLESAVISADKLDLVRADHLRRELEERPGVPGVPALRRLLDAPTFAITDSVLERRFLRLVAEAGLPRPETGVIVAGFASDFCWPELGLIVETDGLRYHRTPSQQARDRRRDNAYAEAGFSSLRFTHEQVTRHPAEVRRTLVAVVARLREEREGRAA